MAAWFGQGTVSCFFIEPCYIFQKRRCLISGDYLEGGIDSPGATGNPTGVTLAELSRTTECTAKPPSQQTALLAHRFHILKTCTSLNWLFSSDTDVEPPLSLSATSFINFPPASFTSFIPLYICATCSFLWYKDIG